MPRSLSSTRTRTSGRSAHAPFLAIAAAIATGVGVGVGALALAVVSAGRSDPAGVVVAVYIGVTATAVLPVILADLRAPSGPAPGGSRATTATTAPGTVALLSCRQRETEYVDEAADMLIVDATLDD